MMVRGLPRWLSGKLSTCSPGDMGLIPGLGNFLGGGNGNSLQYSAWKIPSTEEPDGLQSRGDHKRVRHNLATKQQQQMMTRL